MRKLIALGVSVFLLALGMPVASAFAQSSSADQTAGNTGGSQASNSSSTSQSGGQSQSGAGMQQVSQDSDTVQKAESDADADQDAVNANVTVNVGGHDVYAGDSSASQTLSNTAYSSASNEASTNQTATQNGAGGAQTIDQDADTKQSADSRADARQNAVNANVAVNIAGGNIHAGNSSATQDLENSAYSKAENKARTDQDATQTGGGAQSIYQDADTHQHADSKATAKQNAVNANVPVNIAGGRIHAGDSSASQYADNSAFSKAENKAWTDQDANQTSAGGAQKIDQDADTKQSADSRAKAEQDAVNANVPVNIGGKKVESGDASATQYLDNSAYSKAENKAGTEQDASQTQGTKDSCTHVCGGHAQGQKIDQDADTVQYADSDAKAEQDATNTGGSQTADNSAASKAENKAWTDQDASQTQSIESSCQFLCGGHAQGQWVSQDAKTVQFADSDAKADQKLTNTGGTQDADNSAYSKAENKARTDQDASQTQKIADGCKYLCGGHAQGQWIDQSATTVQFADSDADADQKATNAGGEQDLENSAWSKAKNEAHTDQNGTQTQVIVSMCQFLCGGNVQGQWLAQDAKTIQFADSDADADQHAVNGAQGGSVDPRHDCGCESPKGGSAPSSGSSGASSQGAVTASATGPAASAATAYFVSKAKGKAKKKAHKRASKAKAKKRVKKGTRSKRARGQRR